jgi:hypothetical protein
MECDQCNNLLGQLSTFGKTYSLDMFWVMHSQVLSNSDQSVQNNMMFVRYQLNCLKLAAPMYVDLLRKLFNL